VTAPGAGTPLRVLDSPAAVGDYVATRLLDRIEQARLTSREFLLGCPTGRSPRPVFAAMARQLAATRQPLSHVVLVMMDEYLVPGAGDALVHAPATAPWSCHHFAGAEIVAPLNAPLPAPLRIREAAVWFPDPRDPAAYEARLADAGGIDYFMLASGAGDGHVAFNPPGSPRDSRTRVIALSEQTRRDNLETFPSFGTLATVPFHGVSVGIATIAAAREAAMIVWGAGKRLTLRRMLGATSYDAAWPATVIHEVAGREIVCDADAAGSDE
jgi:glucosamine-6-phosphate deaminase